jgi:AraC-like DNA-binding protein
MSKSLPLVNLSVLRPVLAALREREIDPEPVLESAGLTEGAVISDDVTVHVMVIHQFLEACALALEDPTFCASVGARLDPTGWPMIEAALAAGGSLADFLSTYVSRANEVASSVTAFLDVRGEQAVFGETRLFRPTILPAQNDGFMISLAVTILRRAVGDRFVPGNVTLILCDPRVLPASFSDYSRLKGDEMGFRIRFPSAWLALSLDRVPSRQSVGKSAHAENTSPFLADFRTLVAGRIDQGGLSADGAAALVSMSRSKLSRRLAKEGTSISAEIRQARLAVARTRLRSTDQPIDQIAAALGYSDPSNFTRAFREAEGISPRAYRSRIDDGDAWPSCEHSDPGELGNGSDETSGLILSQSHRSGQSQG